MSLIFVLDWTNLKYYFRFRVEIKFLRFKSKKEKIKVFMIKLMNKIES